MVEVSLTVGKLDASLALLLTKDHHLIEFPTLLLPENVEAGSIVKISCERDQKEEASNRQIFDRVQAEILEEFGVRAPSQPRLRIRNITQTSVVLEWDRIDVATARVKSLTLYKNNARFGVITNPLQRTSTKISGLAIDTAYTFHLKLATTAGTYISEVVSLKTSKMTDLTGITMCVGSLEGSQIDASQLAEIANKIGAKPLQDAVKVDTTHFICTRAEGAQCMKAQELNIPVVAPEWVKACETERRLVGVTAYYLDADPKNRPPLPRTESHSSSASGSQPSTVPQMKVTAPSIHEREEAKKSLDVDKPVPELPKEEEEEEEEAGEGAETEPKPSSTEEIRHGIVEEQPVEVNLGEAIPEVEEKAVEVNPSEEAISLESSEATEASPIEEAIPQMEPSQEKAVEELTRSSQDGEIEHKEPNGVGASIVDVEPETEMPGAEDLTDVNAEPETPINTAGTVVVENLTQRDGAVNEEKESDAMASEANTTVEASAEAPTETKKKKRKNKKKNKSNTSSTAPELLAPEEMDDVEL
ncbi:chitin biosynthesis protein Chs5p [Trichomonascus vanleenenianus]|uniref:Chs5p n=1 Tax=Trichomonascus vanleenenianus TaxID=2268995 RepID=UPI003ECADFBA